MQKTVFPRLTGVTYRSGPLLDGYLRWLATASDVDYSTDLAVAFGTWLRRGEGSALVSWEGLGGMQFVDDPIVTRKRTAQRLSEMGEDTRILLVLRRQDRMLRAMYAQYVHTGGDRSEREFVEGRAPNGNFRVDRLCYADLVAEYLGLFGRSNVQVLLHEQVLDDPRTVVAAIDALSDSAVDLPDRSDPPWANRSLDGTSLALLRAVNGSVRRSQFVSEPRLLAIPWAGRSRSILQSPRLDRLSEIGPRSDPWRWLPPESREQIMASNRELASIVPAVAGYGYLDL